MSCGCRVFWILSRALYKDRFICVHFFGFCVVLLYTQYSIRFRSFRIALLYRSFMFRAWHARHPSLCAPITRTAKIWTPVTAKSPRVSLSAISPQVRARTHTHTRSNMQSFSKPSRLGYAWACMSRAAVSPSRVRRASANGPCEWAVATRSKVVGGRSGA